MNQAGSACLNLNRYHHICPTNADMALSQPNGPTLALLNLNPPCEKMVQSSRYALPRWNEANLATDGLHIPAVKMTDVPLTEAWDT